mmetsp:Transcript_3250/g.6129  ORF Transcript_3250/g.6129 Transcript_3250/m.6129 type:complete len:307 (-) Transcript_3250:52-972(-)
MAVLFKSGEVIAPEHQDDAEFEDEVAARFVTETQFQLFHYCRALALKAEFLARHEQFDKALLAVEDLKMVYNPALHSKVIADEYALDHAANVIALSVQWLHYFNRDDEALLSCNNIIKYILPVIGKEDFLGFTLLLLPTMQYLTKTQGQAGAIRSRELYHQHVAGPLSTGEKKNSHAKSIMRQVMILLQCCSSANYAEGKLVEYEGMDDDIAWILDGEEKVLDWTDTLYTNTINWNMFSLLADVCLHLARRVGGEDQRRRLIEEGLRLSRLAEPKMRDDDGNITNPIGYSLHIRIYSEIESLNVKV